MIPDNIAREHILSALREIDQKGLASERFTTKFFVSFNGKYYPSKYVISVANKFANGQELDLSAFSGADETNSYFGTRGFETVLIDDMEIFYDDRPKDYLNQSNPRFSGSNLRAKVIWKSYLKSKTL